jgi:hypothetical protein
MRSLVVQYRTLVKRKVALNINISFQFGYVLNDN